MRRAAGPTVVALAVVLVACGDGREIAKHPSRAPEVDQVMRGIAAELTPVPGSVSAECEEAPELELACPRLLPAVDGRYRAKAFDTRGADYLVLDISYSAPYPQLTGRNAPPRFVHIVIKAGDLAEAFAFAFPSPPTEPPELPRRYQDAPLTLGRFTWEPTKGSSRSLRDTPLAVWTEDIWCSAGPRARPTWRCPSTRGLRSRM